MTIPSNRLADSTSPYLLQHKDNPVDWYMWGEEAFSESRRSGRAILLSIGYASCHWCHVMAHESFENEEVAQLMNSLFVNIKLDREERPDLDHFYMTALHSMGESGGWPMTMFLDSHGLPFYGGTYFPPHASYGRAAFSDVLRSIAQAYSDNFESISEYTERLRLHIESTIVNQSHADSQSELVNFSAGECLPLLQSLWDFDLGGMQGSPKFPQAPLLLLLSHIADNRESLAHKEADTMLKRILQSLAQGGIYDHVGGGWARYSVDDHWFVPHFEKMLYDNALLLSVYVDAWRRGGQAIFAQRIAELVAWLLSDMQIQGGGFASSRDADSEGIEGKYYLWTQSEVMHLLTPHSSQAQAFCKAYAISEHGNWIEHGAGFNIPHLLHSEADCVTDFSSERKILLQARQHRIAPELDGKILADWNGLMISSLAKASVVMGNQAYFELACQAFQFICETMQQKGFLSHSQFQNRNAHPGQLSDYASLILAAIELQSASGFFPQFVMPIQPLENASTWCTIIKKHFYDAKANQLYMSSDQLSDSPIRMCEWQDNATPASSALATLALAEMFHINGDIQAYEICQALCNANQKSMLNSGFAYPTLIRAFETLTKAKRLIATHPNQKDITILRTLSPHQWRVFILSENNSQHIPQAIISHWNANNKNALQKKQTSFSICQQGICNPPTQTLKL